MNDQQPNDSSEDQEIEQDTPRKFPKLPRRKTKQAISDTPVDTPAEGRKFSEQIARMTIEPAQETFGRLQRRFGEDYYVILTENPIMADTLSRSALLYEDQILLHTAFNAHWTTTVFWGSAAKVVTQLEHGIGSVAGRWFHYGPGHIKQWDEVNKFMDTAIGVGHRLKFGHSIEYLPQIIENFGLEGVPAYFLHLLQDFTTVDGIPIVQNAWEIKKQLERAGLSPKTATRMVSINFARTLSSITTAIWLYQVWQDADARFKLSKQSKYENYLKTAQGAAENSDYTAAIINLQRALELEREPQTLMTLGHIYMQRETSRLRSHQAFTEAVTMLSTDINTTVYYGGATLSLRGIAGTQALSTADVLSEIHPEHWNDYIQDLVNATVYSFASTAEKQFESRVTDPLVAPAKFSAAINYYLAAKSACYYPLMQDRQEIVVNNLKQALRSLGLVAQYDEEQLREPISTIQKLWAMELMPPDEIEMALGTYI